MDERRRLGLSDAVIEVKNGANVMNRGLEEITYGGEVF